MLARLRDPGQAHTTIPKPAHCFCLLCTPTGAQQGLQDDSMFITSAAALPCQPRPPLLANPRTLSSGNWSIQTIPETNATRVVIKHAPIAGVTPQMMMWVFRNMDKVVQDPWSPQANRSTTKCESCGLVYSGAKATAALLAVVKHTTQHTVNVAAGSCRASTFGCSLL